MSFGICPECEAGNHAKCLGDPETQPCDCTSREHGESLCPAEWDYGDGTAYCELPRDHGGSHKHTKRWDGYCVIRRWESLEDPVLP